MHEIYCLSAIYVDYIAQPWNSIKFVPGSRRLNTYLLITGNNEEFSGQALAIKNLAVEEECLQVLEEHGTTIP